MSETIYPSFIGYTENNRSSGASCADCTSHNVETEECIRFSVSVKDTGGCSYVQPEGSQGLVESAMGFVRVDSEQKLYANRSCLHCVNQKKGKCESSAKLFNEFGSNKTLTVDNKTTCGKHRVPSNLVQEFSNLTNYQATTDGDHNCHTCRHFSAAAMGCQHAKNYANQFGGRLEETLGDTSHHCKLFETA